MSYSRYWTEISLQWRFVWGNIIKKRLRSYSWYWTGTSLEWRFVWGNIIKNRLMSFAFGKTPHISRSCRLVPVQYQEYEYAQAYASTLLTPADNE